MIQFLERIVFSLAIKRFETFRREFPSISFEISLKFLWKTNFALFLILRLKTRTYNDLYFISI